MYYREMYEVFTSDKWIGKDKDGYVNVVLFGERDTVTLTVCGKDAICESFRKVFHVPANKSLSSVFNKVFDTEYMNMPEDEITKQWCLEHGFEQE